MIIVEGTDKAGKTTFLSNLINRFPEPYRQKLQVVHFGILPEDWDYCNDYKRYVKSNVILDRFVDSERAYGPVYRDGINKKLTEEHLISVYRKCAEMGTIVAYCNPDIDEVVRRLEKDGDEMIKKREQLEMLRSQFDSIFNDEYPLEVEVIDTTSRIPDEVYDRLVSRSILRERMADNLDRLNMRASITPNTNVLIYTDWYDGNPDQMLFDMKKLGIKFSISNIGVVSSRNIENKSVNISELVMALSKIEKIIVLGREAMKDYVLAGNQLACKTCLELNDFVEIFR